MNNNIVLLHGWGADATRFNLLVKRLTEYGYNPITIDLPGFGNEEPPERPWGVDDYVSWLHEYLMEREITEYVLLGHSFGGQISIQYAWQFPDEVESIILISPAAVRLKRKPHQWIIKGIVEMGRFIMRLPGLNYLYEYARWVLYRLIGQADYYKANGVMRETMKLILQEDLRDLFPQIIQKVLLIWGTEDVFTPFSMTQYYTDLIPNIEFKPYKDKGHNFFYIDVDELTEDIHDFITS